jgi:ABC-2 type transport system permease protein
MNKILLLIQREYLSRVKKKSFIIMTILGPVLFAAITIAPFWLAQVEDEEMKVIAVVDSSHLFFKSIPETDHLKFTYMEPGTDINKLKHTYAEQGFWGILYISHIVTYTPNAVELISSAQPSFSTKIHIKNALEKEIERQKLLANNINDLDQILKSVKTNIDIRIIKLNDGGDTEKVSDSSLAMIIGYASGFLIYLFIFMFGTQVMRGVIEEKTSRIVEVIISSVKPYELMLGKIIGIAGVGLTQFLVWVFLTLGLIGFSQRIMLPDLSKSATEKVLATDIMSGKPASVQAQPLPQDDKMAAFKDLYQAMQRINIGVLVGAFIFFFLGGYLLYASLFAAVGSAVDSDTDTQQFMLPITIPLILAIYVMINTINNPEGQVSFWCSFIPLTSPIVMMVRIPFGVPWWQVGVSALILVITFTLTTLLAARIYRTGILMYGKKVTYRELWKWLRY